MLPNAEALLVALHDALSHSRVTEDTWLRTIAVTPAGTTWRFAHRTAATVLSAHLPSHGEWHLLTSNEVEQVLGVLAIVTDEDPLLVRRRIIPRHEGWDCMNCEMAVALEEASVVLEGEHRGRHIKICPGCGMVDHGTVVQDG